LETKKITVLSPTESVALWLEKREARDIFNSRNRDISYNFSGVDFSRLKELNNLKTIEFNGFTFKGCANFENCNFGDGDVVFRQCRFYGDTLFIHTQFGTGNIIFEGVHFEQGVSFYSANFGNGNIDFDRTDFGNGDVTFTRASFGEGKLEFFGNVTGGLKFFFDQIQSKAEIYLENLRSRSDRRSRFFSFQHSTLEKSVIIPTEHYTNIPDFRNSRILKPIPLNDISISLQREKSKWWQPLKAVDKRDASKIRKLKELAEADRNHQTALAFHANEQRANRWHSMNAFQSILDCAFSLLSDYGQSVLRPLVGLLYMNAVLVCFFIGNSDWNWLASLRYVVANSLPFLAYSRKVSEKSLLEMYGSSIPEFVPWLAFGQGIGSLILLFLISLGLRNQFRI